MLQAQAVPSLTSDQRTEVERIRLQIAWPLFPFLPLKSRTRRDEIGFSELRTVFAGIAGVLDEPIVLFSVGIYQLPGTYDELVWFATEHYYSIEECVADGWVTD